MGNYIITPNNLDKKLEEMYSVESLYDMIDEMKQQINNKEISEESTYCVTDIIDKIIRIIQDDDVVYIDALTTNSNRICIVFNDCKTIKDIMDRMMVVDNNTDTKTRGFEVVSDAMRKTTGDITLPTRGSSKAMAYDFYANDTYTIEPNKIAKIWTDVKAYMGDDECLVLNVRSSMGGKFMLANTLGWIDADYYSNENNDGNIGVFLKNISDETLVINKGERVAQGTFFNFLIADNGNTDKLRTGGFGSSGK